jgi:hypothetical protein
VSRRPPRDAIARDRAAGVGDRSRCPGRRAAEASGQAAVELVALLPLLVAVALALLQALAAGLAAELAGNAAHSGAVAIAEGRDGTAAARAALPGWARSRVDVEVRGARVRVTVTPPSLLPGAAARLATTATADAGPRA